MVWAIHQKCCRGGKRGPAIASAASREDVKPVRAKTEASTKHCISFRPCIDIHKGTVKQIVGSSLKDLPSNLDSQGNTLVTNFESSFPASFYAELYQKSSLTGGHVIMLGADQASKQAAFGALMRYPGGLQLGGGVTAENAEQYLEAGASHVIVTSYVFRDGRLDEKRLQKLLDLVGKDKLVLDLSCRKKDGAYYVVTDRWQKFSELEITQENIDFLEGKCAEFLVHGVDVEGKQAGIDEELISLLGQLVKIPITYAGGATTLNDLERVKLAGNGKVDITVGSALDIFGGKLPYQAVLDWHNLQR